MLFQFTHPRGVRHIRLRCIDATTTFQFTHPRGVRLQREILTDSFSNVSIHAPTRGATATRNSNRQFLQRFNSRTHEGCDV